jgi:hypothetical protein
MRAVWGMASSVYNQSLFNCPKYFPIMKRRSEYGIPIQNRRSTGVIVVSGGGLHPTYTDILCLLCMFFFYLQYCRKKPFSSLKLDSRQDPDFTRQAMCSSGLTKIAPSLVI